MSECLGKIVGMDLDTFWKIVETARAGDEPFADALVDVLAERTTREILAFDARFTELHRAVYRWDVWAAAYLIGGGCSDDAFIDFRAGLIALGRDRYERTAQSPDTLADHPAVLADAADEGDEAIFDEDANYAAANAYERATGDGDAFYARAEDRRAALAVVAEPDPGESFDFDDDAQMHARLPRLAALYLDGDDD